MSYDLSICGDERYERKTLKQPLIEVSLSLAGVKPNGSSGLVLDEPPIRWMEIDLEVVSEDGDNIEEADQEYPEINCLRLHIPYGFFRRPSFRQEYLPTALAIARHLNWTLVDEQNWGKMVMKATFVRHCSGKGSHAA
jgi:hypothetical protein